MPPDTLHFEWPSGMAPQQSAECPPIGDLARIAEEGGPIDLTRCCCERCVNAIVDAIVNANFARRMHSVPPPALHNDSVPGIRIRLDPPLGRGGQASVFFGVDPQTTDCVAVKLLARERCDSSIDVARVFYEAICLMQLASPGLVEFHSCGVTRTGKPYLCTRYVEGPTLGQLLRDHRDTPPAGSERVVWSLRVIAGILRPLVSMHERGMVHRDLKPSNILMRAGLTPVLLDLGIAASSTQEPLPAGHAARFSGSIPYAAPERILRGDDANHPSVDVYSLGVMLRELVNLQEAAGVPLGRAAGPLRELIAKATHEQPGERFTDARGMLQAVESLLPVFERPGKRLRGSIGVVAALVVASGAASVLSTIWMTRESGVADSPAPRDTPASDPGDFARAEPLASTPHDALRAIRSRWSSTGAAAPDFDAAIRSLVEAQVYFGVREPLDQWGYLGGATVGGQITTVADRPLEVIHRDGRFRLGLHQPMTGVTRSIEWPREAFPRTALSPNGVWLLVYGSGDSFVVYDRATLSAAAHGVMKQSTRHSPVIADDGRHVARTDGEGGVWLWSEGGAWEKVFTVDPIQTACVFSGRRLIVATSVGEVMLYDLDTRSVSTVTVARPPCPPYLLRSRDGTTIFTLLNGQTSCSRDDGSTWTDLSRALQVRDTIAISSDSATLVVFSQGVARTLDGGNTPAVQTGYTRVVHAAASDGGRMLVTHGRTWRLLDALHSPPWSRVSADVPSEMAAQRLADRRIFVGERGVWSVALDSTSRVCLWPRNTSNASIDDDAGRMMVSGFAGDIAMIDSATGAQRWAVRREALATPVVALNAQLAVAGGGDGSVLAFDPATGDQLWAGRDQRYRVRGIDLAAGRVATSSASPGVVVYDAVGTKLATCRIVDARCVALSPDGERTFTGTDRGTLVLAGALDNVPGQEVPAHDGGVWSVAVNRTGTLAATGGGDGIVRLWWTNPLTPLTRFAISPEEASVVFDVRFTDDSRRLMCTIGGQGAYEIDLAAHERAMTDWLARDRAYSYRSGRETVVTPDAGKAADKDTGKDAGSDDGERQ